MDDKLVRLSDIETELLKVTERYTVAHEANGTGRVVWSDNLISLSCALNAVRSIPAVDAVEVRHSHWEDVEVEDVGELTPLYVQSIASMRCASCNRYHNEAYHYGNPTEMARYCPYCGARMDGEDGDA